MVGDEDGVWRGELYSGPSRVSSGKHSYRENMSTYILLERLRNVDFAKKYEKAVFFYSAKETCKTTSKMTIRYSIE